MRPKKHERTGEEDLFRARLDQIIDMKHEPVQLMVLFCGPGARARKCR